MLVTYHLIPLDFIPPITSYFAPPKKSTDQKKFSKHNKESELRPRRAVECNSVESRKERDPLGASGTSGTLHQRPVWRVAGASKVMEARGCPWKLVLLEASEHFTAHYIAGICCSPLSLILPPPTSLLILSSPLYTTFLPHEFPYLTTESFSHP